MESSDDSMEGAPLTLSDIGQELQQTEAATEASNDVAPVPAVLSLSDNTTTDESGDANVRPVPEGRDNNSNRSRRDPRSPPSRPSTPEIDRNWIEDDYQEALQTLDQAHEDGHFTQLRFETGSAQLLTWEQARMQLSQNEHSKLF